MAQAEYTRLNEIVGQQTKEGKDNTEEMQLLHSINQKKEFIKSNPFSRETNLTTGRYLSNYDGADPEKRMFRDKPGKSRICRNKIQEFQNINSVDIIEKKA